MTPLRWNRFVIPKRRPPPSPRRVAAARRAVEKDKASVPLFPELVHHNTPEDRIADKDADVSEHFCSMRDFHAEQWRRARRQIRALPEPTRSDVIAHWNLGICPLDPGYLLGLLRDVHANPNYVLEYWAELDRARQTGAAWALRKLFAPPETDPKETNETI